MKCLATCCVVIVAALHLVSPAIAEVPRLINYQGSLTDSNGHPLYGQHVVTFKMYYVLSGGTPKWEESHVVDVYEGLFNVILGGTTALPDTLFEHDLWMGLTVGVDPELMPRMQLTTVPWAYRTAVADSALAAGCLPGHDHDDRYYTETELNTNDGKINEISDPVDWTKLKSVPAGFADGVDDVGNGITAVWGGAGLAGGDTTGEITLDVNVGTGIEIGGDTVQLTGEYSSGSAYDSRFVNVENLDHLDAADGSPENAVYVDNDGDVGIGTITPQGRLDIRGGSLALEGEAGTAGQVLTSQGAGVSPAWVSSPASGWNYVGSVVFSGASPYPSWSDLDLSGFVGSNRAVVLIAANPLEGCTVEFRMNGETDSIATSTGSSHGAGITGGCMSGSSRMVYLWVPTDADGIVEWRCYETVTMVLTLVGYIK